MSSTARALLTATASAYGLYAAFLLIEVLDFLALLHSPDEGYHATYDMTVVGFFMVEQVICTVWALLFLLLRLHSRPGEAAIVACLLLSAARFGLVYFLYWWDNGTSHTVPFIYKDANIFSDGVRFLMVPIPILLGLASAWACRKPRPTPQPKA